MGKFTKTHELRLLNVAVALLESPNPVAFTMGRYAWSEDEAYINGFDCGTPACALGHYAARRDVQNTFLLGKRRYGGYVVKLAAAGRGDKRYVCYGDPRVRDHFGISKGEAEKIFSERGCDDAKTPVAAATYIVRFVQRKREERAKRVG